MSYSIKKFSPQP